MIIQTEAIVLKSFDFRETSRIATFFTRDHGKIKGILKGIRKDPKKFGSNIDQFSVNDIVYYTHRNSELHLVSQCDLKNFFFPIREDLKRTLAASYILELVHAMLPLEEPNPAIYQLMQNFLNSLETELDISKLVHIFQVKILGLSGFQPHLDACMKTGKPIEGRAKFSSRLGGLVAQDVELEDMDAIPISKGTVSSILHIEKNNWQACLRLGLSNPIQKELKHVLNNFLVFHLERHLKSYRYV